MDDHTDTDLLAAWMTGDQEAYAVLVARHHALVRSACLRAAPPGDVDDCVQAVFLVLTRRGRQAARAPALVAWLLRTACLVCRCARRARERRRRAEVAAATEAVRGADPTRPEALDHLDECLQRLPERQRVAISMTYLAGRSAEEVATALGTSRDNAYQLLSRGLVGLRELLARRGVAVGAAALGSLLAAEAQAAAVPAPAAVITTLTTTSASAAAATLASGAMTAMTLAVLTPIACAAGLLLAAATVTVALTAEPAAIPEPAPAVAAQPAAWDALPKDERLWQQRLTYDFQAVNPVDISLFFGQVTGRKNAILLSITAPVTMRCRGMPVANCLVWLAIITDSRLAVHEGVIELAHVGPTAVEPPPIASPDDQTISTALAQKKITGKFKNADLSNDVIPFLEKVSDLNIIVHPRSGIRQFQSGFTVKADQMPMTEILALIAKQANCRVVVRNGAIGFLPIGVGVAVASTPTLPAEKIHFGGSNQSPAPAAPEPTVPTSTF